MHNAANELPTRLNTQRETERCREGEREGEEARFDCNEIATGNWQLVNWTRLLKACTANINNVQRKGGGGSGLQVEGATALHLTDTDTYLQRMLHCVA